VQDNIGPRRLGFRDAARFLSERIEIAVSERVGFGERMEGSDCSEELGVYDGRFGPRGFEQLAADRLATVSNHAKSEDRTERQRRQQGANDEKQQMRS
jgi:hypothetical protein